MYIQKVYNSRFTSEIKKLEKYYDPKARIDYKQILRQQPQPTLATADNL